MKNRQHSDQDRLQDYRKTVRIFGIRKAKFLEFDFTVGFEELTIELVMPYPAFKEFCETNHVEEIDCLLDVKAEYDKMAGGKFPRLIPPEKGREQLNMSVKDKSNIIDLGEYQ